VRDSIVRFYVGQGGSDMFQITLTGAQSKAQNEGYPMMCSAMLCGHHSQSYGEIYANQRSLRALMGFSPLLLYVLRGYGKSFEALRL
jgi:hypothetical protein